MAQPLKSFLLALEGASGFDHSGDPQSRAQASGCDADIMNRIALIVGQRLFISAVELPQLLMHIFSQSSSEFLVKENRRYSLLFHRILLHKNYVTSVEADPMVRSVSGRWGIARGGRPML